MIWSCIIGGFIGFIAGSITKKRGSMGIIAKVVAGLLGSSVIGAVIVIAVVSFFFGKKN